MRKVNLGFGFFLFFVFLCTGFYMKMVFKPEHLLDTTARMEIRASHLYILYISLLNILSYNSYSISHKKQVKILNELSSLLLIFAGLLGVSGFLMEHGGTLTDRKLTLLAAISSLAGVFFCFAGNLLTRKENEKI